MNRDQKLIAEAYERIIVKEAGFINKIKTVVKGITSGTKDTMTPEDFKNKLEQAVNKTGTKIEFKPDRNKPKITDIWVGDYKVGTLNSLGRVISLGSEWLYKFQKETGLETWPLNGDTINKFIKAIQNRPKGNQEGGSYPGLRGAELYQRFGAADPGAAYPGMPSRRI
jgi:hypothetical protein